MTRTESENSISQGNRDMLSSLPDPILHQIMSFMPAREAVQLCVLSKRWETLWTTLPVLNFGFREFRNNPVNHSSCNREKRFTYIVSMVLFLREATSQLHTLTLNCFQNYSVVPGDMLYTSIRLWIRYAIKCNLRVLTIKNINIFFPSEVFTCPSLEYVTLNITGPIDTPEVINLPSLKQLRLIFSLVHDRRGEYTTEFDEDFMSKLLCGCPVLEDLHVEGGVVEFFKITSHSLKHLKFTAHCYAGSNELSAMIINCPNLLSFHFRTCYCQEKGIILNMPSLHEACIQFDTEFRTTDVTKSNILCGLSNVLCLELGRFLGGRSLPADFLKAEIANCRSFSKLTCLSLSDLCLNCLQFSQLSSLLEHCPNLKKLSLRLSDYCVCIKSRNKQIEVARFKCEQLETVEVKFYLKSRIFDWVVKCLREAVAELPNCRIITTGPFYRD